MLLIRSPRNQEGSQVLTTPSPIQYIATTDDDIEQLRAEIFRGQLDDSVLCEVMGWSDRTRARHRRWSALLQDWSPPIIRYHCRSALGNDPARNQE